MPSRIRDRGGYVPGPPRASFWWNTSQNPKPSPTYSSVPDVDGTVERMVDEVIPNYHERSARGELFFNPMSHSWETRQCGESFGPRFKAVVGSTTYWGELLGGPWQSSPSARMVPMYCKIDTSSLAREAATAALGKVNKSDFSALVTLGELSETLAYLRNPFKTGMRLAANLQTKLFGLQSSQKLLLSSLKRKGYSNVYAMDPRRYQRALAKVQSMASRNERQLINNTVNLYMEFRYGVRPLISEVEQFLTAQLEPYKMRRSERQTYRSGRSEDASATLDQIESIANGSITYNAHYDLKRSYDVSAGYLYEFAEELTEFERLGISMHAIPSAALDLIPLSFVAGWFFNTAQLVAAITPVAGAHQLGSWLVERTTYEVWKTASGWKFNSSGWTTAQDGGGTDYAKIVYKSRRPLGFSDIGIVLKQDFTSALGDPFKLLDMGSIIYQRVMGQKISTRT